MGINRPPPGFKEDPNSPLDLSSDSAGTYNLAETYEVVKIVTVETLSGGTGNSLRWRFNGDSGSNYDWLEEDGSKSSGNGSWIGFAESGGISGQVVICSGVWDRHFWANANPRVYDAGTPRNLRNKNINSPLTQFRIFDPFLSDVGAKFHVFGNNFQETS